MRGGGGGGREGGGGIAPGQLARHYSRFRVSERVLLTGHSHQAWPDVAFEAQQQAWLDAAEMVDDKWGRAFEVAGEVRAGYRRLLDDPDGHIALGQNTHELLIRFLSALPLRERPRLVTTDGEFHTIRRQLDRLEEEGIEVVRVGVGADFVRGANKVGLGGRGEAGDGAAGGGLAGAGAAGGGHSAGGRGRFHSRTGHPGGGRPDSRGAGVVRALP